VDANLPANTVRSAWPPADGWWSVAAEFPATQGRLDIVVKNHGPSGPATIVIENKWNCGLGDRQLERYGDYLANLGGSMSSHRKCLVYLTKNGEAPSVSPAVELVCLSHSIHISRLIQNTLALLPDTAPPALKEPLWQYCSILVGDD
jgi:hypothetical protein